MSDDDATGIEDSKPREVFWPGPWHFVQARLERPEMWGVNNVPRLVQDMDIIGFMITDDAMHFVAREKAVDLGVWISRQELDEAIAAHNAKLKAEEQKKAAAEQPHRRKGKGKEAERV